MCSHACVCVCLCMHVSICLFVGTCVEVTEQSRESVFFFTMCALNLGCHGQQHVLFCPLNHLILTVFPRIQIFTEKNKAKRK